MRTRSTALLTRAQAIASELIFLRVSTGRAWTASTRQELSHNIRFANNSNAASGTLGTAGQVGTTSYVNTNAFSYVKSTHSADASKEV
jgi:hypothetical protein